MTVNPRCYDRVEITDIGRIHFQETARIALAPTVKSATFKHDDLLRTCFNVNCMDPAQSTTSNLRKRQHQVPSFSQASSNEIPSNDFMRLRYAHWGFLTRHSRFFMSSHGRCL